MMFLLASAIAISAAALRSEDIEAPGPQGALRGTLTRAAEPDAPVALIIPGSGPTDRDGNSPLGIGAAPYRMLAEELGSKGVSTVRIDKRGMFESAAAVPDANAVTIDDYVDDIGAWVGAIREQTGTDCIWLLGHSEGGLVALAASRRQQDICGLVLVATAGRPLGAVMKQQLRANLADEPLLARADAAIDALAAGNHVDGADLPPPLAALFAPPVQNYLISAFSLDPAELAGSVAQPILIVQGDSDLQVGMADAELLQRAAPEATLVHLSDTNHVLKSVAANDMAANLATYGDPDLPLAPNVTNSILEFIGARAPHGR